MKGESCRFFFVDVFFSFSSVVIACSPESSNACRSDDKMRRAETVRLFSFTCRRCCFIPFHCPRLKQWIACKNVRDFLGIGLNSPSKQALFCRRLALIIISEIWICEKWNSLKLRKFKASLSCSSNKVKIFWFSSATHVQHHHLHLAWISCNLSSWEKWVEYSHESSDEPTKKIIKKSMKKATRIFSKILSHSFTFSFTFQFSLVFSFCAFWWMMMFFWYRIFVECLQVNGPYNWRCDICVRSERRRT